MFAYREKRIHPEIDDKILTDWNSLMIKALTKASQAFGDVYLYKKAENLANFILAKLRKKDGGLYHRYRNNESGINGQLDDYAFFIDR